MDEQGLTTTLQSPQTLLRIPESALEQQVDPVGPSENYCIELYDETLHFIALFLVFVLLNLNNFTKKTQYSYM